MPEIGESIGTEKGSCAEYGAALKLGIVCFPLLGVGKHSIRPADLLEGVHVDRVLVRMVTLGQVVEGLLQRGLIHTAADAQDLIIVWLWRGHVRPSAHCRSPKDYGKKRDIPENNL